MRYGLSGSTLTMYACEDAILRCGPRLRVEMLFQKGLLWTVYCSSSMSTEMVNTSRGACSSYA